MGLTRRGFLLGTGLLGTGVLAAGCAKEVSGTATADPDAIPTRDEPEPSKPDGPDDPDKVTVGILVYPPYTVVDGGGQLTGPVPDVARAVLERLGITEVVFTQVQQPEQVIVLVQSGRIDFGAGLGVSPDRCSSFRFTRPDHISGTAFAVPAGNPRGLKIYADVAAKEARLGVLDGAPEADDAKAAGVPERNLARLSDPAVLLKAVGEGEIDSFAFDDITLRDLVKNSGDGLEVTKPFQPGDRPPFAGAYAFAEDSELFTSFDDELHKLHLSGEWQRMVEPFGFTEDNAPPPDLTIAELCSGR